MTHEELLQKTEEYYQNTDDNIIGVGYGYKTKNGVLTNETSIVFTVKQKIPKEQLTEDKILPKEILISDQKIRTDVVQDEIRLICDSSFYLWTNTGYTVPNKTLIRPLQGGVSSGNITSLSEFTGTLGFLAIDNDTNSLVGVSNNHVYIDDGFICSEKNITGVLTNIKGDFIIQPHESQFDTTGNTIGRLKKYYPLRENTPNYIDAAITTIDQSVVNSGTSFHQYGLSANTYSFATTQEINDFLISGTTSYGSLLYSAGRTTGAKGEGITKLKITQIATSIFVGPYNRQGIGINVDFYDCIGFIAATGSTLDACIHPIWHGDSGSALIADISGVTKIIGLVFAGGEYTGYACRIDRIASLLKISPWNGESVNYSDTSNILEYTVNGLSDAEYIDYNGKRYWQVGLRSI